MSFLCWHFLYRQQSNRWVSMVLEARDILGTWILFSSLRIPKFCFVNCLKFSLLFTMNDTLLLGNINTGPSGNKQKAPVKPAVKREKQPNSFENAGAKRYPKEGNQSETHSREFAKRTQFKPKVPSFNPTAFKISPANRGGFSRIPKPPPPPNSSKRDNESKSPNHQFIKPSNQEKETDVRSKFQFNTSTFKTSKLFDSDTFKEINEIES